MNQGQQNVVRTESYLKFYNSTVYDYYHTIVNKLSTSIFHLKINSNKMKTLLKEITQIRE